MDSSRGGPLSTLILFLPLVVVPAVAILRPAERDSGLVGDDLTASEDAFLSEPDDFFRDLDGETADREHEEDRLMAGDMPFAEGDFRERLTDSGEQKRRHQTPARSHSYSDQPAAQADPPPDLSHLGVSSSLWFNPGNNRGFGFVAFVPTKKDSVRYRFSSIQDTEERAVDDVAQQIRVWRQGRQESSMRRTR